MERKICERCGNMIMDEEKHFVTHDGKVICEDCFDRFYYVCEDCGEIFPHSDTIEIGGTFNILLRIVCQECFEDGCNRGEYITCSDCGGAIFIGDDITTRDGDIICQECFENYYYTCEDCGKVVHGSDITSVDNGDIFICDSCLNNDDEYCLCDSCNHYFTRDNVIFTDDFDCICNDCYDDYKKQHSIIKPYHDHKGEYEYFGCDCCKTPYLGFELEIDGKYEDEDAACELAEEIQDIFPQNFMYFENDSSLEYGFECISNPAKLNYHMELIENYGDMFELISNYGYSGYYDTCGFHVHFNRDFFGSNQESCIAKLLYMVEKFDDDITKFARREENGYCLKEQKRPCEIVKQKGGFDRYSRINLTNRSTIEFRMFQSMSDVNTLIATLQLCNTLVMFAKNKSIMSISKMSFEDLLIYDEIKEYWSGL